MPVRAVIFDIDGTLIDSNEFHIAAWREAFAATGHGVPAERIRPQVGKGGDQLVPAILGDDGERRDGAAVRERHEAAFLEAARREHFQVFPNVQDLLDTLRGRGIKVGLATSSKDKVVDAIQTSARIDLRALADVTVTADAADASKPAPDLVLVTLDKLKLDARECVMVGDTVYDAAAARRAGVRFIGLLCGGCATKESLESARARSVWRDPADLLGHLDAALQ
jgi:HAD superfamily hydrolase (TIGR01509 family)